MATGTVIDLATGEVTTVTLPEPTLAERKAAMREAVRAMRRAVEVGGTTVAGSPIRTDEGSRGNITGAVALFDNDPTLTTIDFEAQPGLWVTLDEATMRAIGVAVGRHVQACFSHARSLDEAITEAADNAALDEINIGAGWP